MLQSMIMYYVLNNTHMSKSVTSVKEVHLLYFTVGFCLSLKYFTKICMKGSTAQLTKSKSRVAKIR